MRCLACLGKKEREEEMSIDNAGIERSIKVNPETLEEIKAALEQTLDPLVILRKSKKAEFDDKAEENQLIYIKMALKLVESLLVIA